MPQPTPYARQHNFTDFQAANPSVPLPGYQVDAELNGIEQTLGGVLGNLALLQRDDGKLAAGVVTVDAVSPELRYAIAKDAGGEPADGVRGEITVTGSTWTINDSVLSAFGRSIVGVATPAVARTLLELGSAAQEAVGLFAVTALDRAALAAITTASAAHLREAGRQGIFKWDSSNLSAMVAADTAQGAYVPPAASTGLAVNGSQGAWVRQYDGPLWFHWFGAVQGDSTANSAANNAAVTALQSLLAAMPVNVVTTNQGLREVKIGPGVYHFSETIDNANGAVVWSGCGMGNSADASTSGITRVVFNGCTGFRFQHHNTTGATAVTSGGKSAVESIARDMSIQGNFPTTGVEAEFHGVHMRVRAHLENVNIHGFAGDGVHIAADTGAAILGNATNWTMDNVNVVGCRDGYHITGNNSGAGKASGGNVRGNRRAGINDENVGACNSYTTAMGTNSFTSYNDGVTIGAAWVSDGTNRFGVIAGQEVGASTNAPPATATNNTWWYYISAGGADATKGCPLWVSGMLLRAGGAVLDNSNTSRNTYLGPYAEGFTGPKSQIVQRSLVLNGMLSQWCFQNPAATKGTAILSGGNNGTISTETAFEANSGLVTAFLGGALGNPNRIILSGYEETYAPNTFSVRVNTAGAISLLDGAAAIGYLTTSATTNQFGTGAAVPQAAYFSKLMVGDTLAGARLVTNGTAAPTTGAHGQGEFVHFRGATANLIGWKCTAAGTPGTWETLYGLTVAPTAAGQALMDDADAAAQRTTLGLGTAATAAKAASSSATYVAPAGGTTVDTEARASLAQLAADLADLKAKFVAAGLQL